MLLFLSCANLKRKIYAVCLTFYFSVCLHIIIPDSCNSSETISGKRQNCTFHIIKYASFFEYMQCCLLTWAEKIQCPHAPSLFCGGVWFIFLHQIRPTLFSSILISALVIFKMWTITSSISGHSSWSLILSTSPFPLLHLLFLLSSDSPFSYFHHNRFLAMC